MQGIIRSFFLKPLSGHLTIAVVMSTEGFKRRRKKRHGDGLYQAEISRLRNL